MSGIEIGTAVAAVSKAATAAKATEQLLKQIKTVSEELKPFKPDIKSFRIDYIGRNSEIKYLLLIPDGLKRQLQRKVEIPAVTGFRFYEMWDLDKMQTVASTWAFNGDKWTLDVTKLPSSEKYWLTVKGRVSQEFLDQLVSVKAAENPSRVQENDVYWIHSALKNVGAFEKIWTELNIEQVNAEVRIGVERMFTSAIPQGVRDRLELQQKLLDAITSGNRDEEQRLKMRYRTSKAKVTPSEISQLLLKLVSGEYFADYVQVQNPFVVNNIEPIKEPGLIVPEKVKVGVLTDLNYDTPVAKGSLCFYRHKYSQSVAEKVKELLPKEKKTK